MERKRSSGPSRIRSVGRGGRFLTRGEPEAGDYVPALMDAIDDLAETIDHRLGQLVSALDLLSQVILDPGRRMGDEMENEAGD